MFNKNISIIIPFYNEASRLSIDKNVDLVLDYMNKHSSGKYELILIDDCSEDITYKTLLQYTNLDNCTVIKNDINSGKGFCIIKGIKIAKYDYILYMDADLSVSIYNIELFINKADKDTCIIASRYLNNSGELYKRNNIRNFMSNFTRVVLIKLCGLNISDSQCGFKLFNNNSKIEPESLKTSRWLFDLEFLRHLKRKGFKFIEIPIDWNNCEKSTLNIKKAIFSSIKELFIILTN